MTSFATLETRAGFPMPELPKRTGSRTLAKNCQETDVDECVQEILLKKNWITAVYDQETTQEWSTKCWSGSKKTDGILRYAVDECRWRQQEWQHRAGTPAAICKAGLVLSKDNVSQELRSSIMNDLKILRQDEESAPSTMALHPKYKKILQLVHPSLYAYEKGVTHVLPGVGAEAVASPVWDSFLGTNSIANSDKPERPDTEGLRNDSLYGNPYQNYDGDEPPTAAECSKFQWLPSEFFVSSSWHNDAMGAKGTASPTCHINSYINNLHPLKYQSLYDKIGELFLETLPLMEEVLSEVNDNGKVRKQLPRFDSKIRKRSSWRPWMRGAPPKTKKVVELPVPEFSPPKHTSEKRDVNLHDRPLQVIVKLISLELKPETRARESMDHEEKMKYFKDPPQYYNGGHWHVEGTHDERIVASACCYLESENVEEEGLHFRDGSVGSRGGELGAVKTFAGRILVWPNYLHHKTGEVGLKDEKKPGHRTLCCFHLVDPTVRIRSTATVPPQQQAWLKEEVVDLALASSEPDDLACSVIHESIWLKDGWVINYEDALERRERLSEERSADSRVLAEHFWTPED